ncbi:MAG: hypothetical protein AB7O67_04420 [Vicinamibacterales bacterium]
MGERILVLAPDSAAVLGPGDMLPALLASGAHVRLALARNDVAASEPLRALEREYPSLSHASQPRGLSPHRALAATLRGLIEVLRLDDLAQPPPPAHQDVLRAVPPLVRVLAHVPGARRGAVRRGLLRGARALERVLPLDPGVVDFLRTEAPAAIILTSLLEAGSSQADYVRAARVLGIPTLSVPACGDEPAAGGTPHEAPDWHCAWSDAHRDLLVAALGIDSRSVIVLDGGGVTHGPAAPAPGRALVQTVLPAVLAARQPPRAHREPTRSAARAIALMSGLARRVDRGVRHLPAPRGARLAVLVATPSVAYLEQYGAWLRRLRSDGHTVFVAFTARSGQPLELFDRLDDLRGVIPVGVVPRRDDGWGPVSDRLLRLAAATALLDGELAPQASRWRRRMLRWILPPELQAVDRWHGRHAACARLARWTARLARAVPPDAGASSLVQEVRPDVLLLLPALDLPMAVDTAPEQASLAAAAAAARVPVVAAAGCLDSGVNPVALHLRPDVALLWTRSQQKPARLWTGRGTVFAVTGAPLHEYAEDDSAETITDAEFRRLLGIAPGRPFVLFAGAGGLGGRPPEAPFVREWLTALRGSRRRGLRDLLVLIRPAPSAARAWRGADFTGLGDVILCPTRYDRSGSLDSVLLREMIRGAAVVVSADPLALTLAHLSGRPAVGLVATETGPAGIAPVDDFTHAGGGPARAASSAAELVRHVADALDGGHVPARADAGWAAAHFLGPDYPSADLVLAAVRDAASRPAAARDAATRLPRPVVALAARALTRICARTGRHRASPTAASSRLVRGRTSLPGLLRRRAPAVAGRPRAERTGGAEAV